MGDMALTINIGTLLTVIVAVATGVGGWFFGSSGSRKLARQAGYFFVDWAGTPARDGVPAVPGVMSRLAGHDQALALAAKANLDQAERQAETAAALVHIQAELRTNGGGSIKDAAMAVGPALADVRTDVAKLGAEVARLGTVVATIPAQAAELVASGPNHTVGG